IFVDRERRTHVGQITRAIEETMNSGVLVILFPEGTSSGGETVLPFKSSLLEPAVRQTHPLYAALIQYELEDGDAGEEVCVLEGHDVPAAPDQSSRQTLCAGASELRSY